MKLNIDNYEVWLENLECMPIMNGYIECANYAEGAKKNFDLFVNKCKKKWNDLIPLTFLDSPPKKVIGITDSKGYLHWTGYYVYVELMSYKATNKCTWECSHVNCILLLEEFDTNALKRRLETEVDWEKDAVNLEVG